MLEIQNRIALGRILLIIRRGVNEAAEFGISALGMVEGLAELAVRHILDRVEALVRGGYFEPAAPAATAIEIQAARVRHLRAVDHDLIIVETFVLRPRDADPGAILTFGQGI